LFAAPAWAAGVVPINPGNVPTTAVGFADHECSANLGGGPFPGQDVWVFVLPQPNTLGAFVSLHLNFTTPGGPVTRDIPADPNSAIVDDLGTSKAWIRTPAGWTLTDATTTAAITGNPDANDHFNLTSTCPGSGTPSPTVTPTVTASVTPTRTELPITGPSTKDDSFIGPAVVGGVLVLGGVALATLRRRRDSHAGG
jgi:hypothetical protein